MVGSCATDVGLVFEKCKPGHVLTCSLPHNCGSKKKMQITIKTSHWFCMHSYQTVSIIFISFLFSIDVDTARLTFPPADIVQTGLAAEHNLFYEMTHQMARTSCVFSLNLVVAGHKRQFGAYFSQLDVHMCLSRIFQLSRPC